jgi:transposase
MEFPNDILVCHQLIARLIETTEQQSVLIGQLHDQNKSLLTKVSVLESKVKELESKLQQNSKNSHKPPSSDPFRAKPAFTRKRGGKRGGQPGHTGHSLELSLDVDIEVPLIVEVCGHCGKEWDTEELALHSVRQEIDIPEPKTVVTEYQSLSWRCGCGHCNLGAYPEQISAPVQYGPRIKTLGVLLNAHYNLSMKKTGQLMEDLYGVKLNDGTQQNNNAKAFQLLEVEEHYIVGQLQASQVAHLDETGIRYEGKRFWLHVACTQFFTMLFVSKRRGKDAHQEDASILHGFKNWIIHDCWATYFLFQLCRHGICGAHLLRELTALIERDSKWAVKMKALLLELYEKSDRGNSTVPKKGRAEILKRYASILKEADLEEPPPKVSNKGKPKQTKGRNLFDRLGKHKDAVLAFAWYKEVPFTNNLAERAIRPTKTKNKVSGCFRTENGAKIYARVQSFVSTVRKHGLNPFNELYAIFSGSTPEYRSVPT